MSARTHVNRGARVLRVLAALVCVALFVGISGFGSEAQARVSSSQSTSSSAGQDPSYSYKEPAGEIDLHIDELKRSHPSQGETGEGDEVDEDEAAGEDPGAEADGATAPSDDAAAAQKQSPYSVPYNSRLTLSLTKATRFLSPSKRTTSQETTRRNRRITEHSCSVRERS